ncbi:intermembrane phospholipid transport protein YdbH family protein [Dongia sedimenti]|uniref:YdbH domain-containing protein n=1 Tax=Dongia sedimenti TaxID=3064282 RepID=A0ABU0YL64_9PROT|nr:YdbH domain-containing protein [Rhodospirillaceae bacterium R-7]
MAEPAPERRKRRRRWPVFVILVLAALLAIGFFAREHLAAWAAAKVLAMRYGVSSRLDIDHLDSHQARIGAVALGGGDEVQASDINLQFEPIAMTVQRIEIGRIEIHARYDGHELTLGELDPMLRELTAGGDGAGQAPLPSIILHKIVLTLDTPLGTLTGDGMATIDQGVVYSQFALSEPYQRSAVRLDLNATLSDHSPQPKGKVTVDLTADSALWTLLGMPQPQAGKMQFNAQLKAPPGDPTASGIRLATGALFLAADWSFSGGDLAWPAQPAPMNIQGSGRAVLTERRLDIPTFSVKATGGWSPDLALQLQGSGLANLDPERYSVQTTLDMKAQTKSANLGAVQFKSPAFDLGLQIQYAGDQLQVRPSRDGTIKFAQAAIGPSIKLTKPATFTIRKTDQTVFTLPLHPNEENPIAASAEIGGTTLELTTPALAAPVQLALPNGAIGFTVGPDGLPKYTLDLKNGTVTSTQPPLVAKNVTVSLKGQGGKLDLSLNAGTWTGPSGIGPGNLDGKASLDGNKLTASAKIGIPTAKASMTAKGGYDLGSGKGRFDLDLPEVTFVPGGLQPKDLAADLAHTTEDIAGTIAAKGPILIDKNGVTSQIALTLKNLSGKLGPIALRNLNSVVEIDKPWPLTTAADQIVSVELADVGLPLTNGLVRFKIDDGSTLSLAESHLEMMSGRVTLDPVILKLGAPAQQIHLKVDKISLGRLFELFAIAGLTGDGVLSGEIPVTLFPAGLAIDHAKLEAGGPGSLKYNQAQAPAAIANAGDSVKMALSALSDFHYDRLEVDLDRKATGDTELGLHISGRNPSFYNGYPVEFNLTVAGRLDEALRKGLAGYQVPDMIREKLKSSNQ